MAMVSMMLGEPTAPVNLWFEKHGGTLMLVEVIGIVLFGLAAMTADRRETLREQAGEYYEQGREKLSEITAEVEDYIRREPLKAALIAAGVGLCVGLCLMRR